MIHAPRVVVRGASSAFVRSNVVRVERTTLASETRFFLGRTPRRLGTPDDASHFHTAVLERSDPAIGVALEGQKLKIDIPAWVSIPSESSCERRSPRVARVRASGTRRRSETRCVEQRSPSTRALRPRRPPSRPAVLFRSSFDLPPRLLNPASPRLLSPILSSPRLASRPVPRQTRVSRAA